jgi:hypothetical protein
MTTLAAACGGSDARPVDASDGTSGNVRVLAGQTPTCVMGVQGVIGANYSVASGSSSVLLGLELIGPEPGATFIDASATFGPDTALFVHTDAGRDPIDRVAAATLVVQADGQPGQPNAVVIFRGPVLTFGNRPDGAVLVAQAAEVTLFPADGKQLRAPPMCTDRTGLVGAAAATIDDTATLTGAAPTAQANHLDLEITGTPDRLRVYINDARIFERSGGAEVTISPTALAGRQLRVRHTEAVLELDRRAAVAAEVEAL